jgi:hypothetical protein
MTMTRAWDSLDGKSLDHERAEDHAERAQHDQVAPTDIDALQALVVAARAGGALRLRSSSV